MRCPIHSGRPERAPRGGLGDGVMEVEPAPSLVISPVPEWARVRSLAAPGCAQSLASVKHRDFSCTMHTVCIVILSTLPEAAPTASPTPTEACYGL